jgi:hypothetical protein
VATTGSTPYVTPDILLNSPTGISWNSIPPGSGVTPAQRTAEQLNICQRASAQADGFCNQTLRATLDVEKVTGPDYRTTIQQSTQNCRAILTRWPILDIISVQVSPNSIFPRQWITVPTGFWDIERPIIGLFGTDTPSAAAEGGQSILIAPGFVNWSNGRNGFAIQVNYINGWPHASLTAAVVAGATSLPVDDCTGWAPFATGSPGAAGIIYDAGNQETVQVTAASATSGPGTLTIANAISFPHASGILLSAFPQSVIWAVTLFASGQALTRGATATTVHVIPGGGAGIPAMKGPDDLFGEGELLLQPYRRTILSTLPQGFSKQCVTLAA